jgi:hypothetical protein
MQINQITSFYDRPGSVQDIFQEPSCGEESVKTNEKTDSSPEEVSLSSLLLKTRRPSYHFLKFVKAPFCIVKGKHNV